MPFQDTQALLHEGGIVGVLKASENQFASILGAAVLDSNKEEVVLCIEKNSTLFWCVI